MPAKNNFSWLAELPPGAELGVSGWHRVAQEDITAFGCLTRDEDPFHVDPEWAVKNSTLGTAIAFGFQTLSMLTFFLHQVFDQRGIEPGAEVQLFNFGFNRVRLPEPVPEGAEVRGRFAFSGSRVRESGGVEISLDAVVEIRNNDRPALVAEWLLVVPGPS